MRLLTLLAIFLTTTGCVVYTSDDDNHRDNDEIITIETIDNYSPEILQLHSSEPPVIGYIQNIVMPTLQQVHQKTAASPRSTAKLFLLMEELSYRHLYRVDRAMLGNFHIASAAGVFDREDDYASSGFRGLADFVTALFKCIESQARGFAHGHGKVHSIPDCSRDLLKCLEKIAQEISDLEKKQWRCTPY